MPRKYTRTTLRASWSEADLNQAMEKVRNKEIGVNEASRIYQISSRTLRRHLLTGRSKVPLGRATVFKKEDEKKLVAHIKKLEKVGFAPDRRDDKEMASRKIFAGDPIEATLTLSPRTSSAVNQNEKTPQKCVIEPIPGPSKMHETPSKLLAKIHPVPKLPLMSSKNKQKAVILTSPEHILKRKLIAEKKKTKDVGKKAKVKLEDKHLKTKLERKSEKKPKRNGKENAELKVRKNKKTKDVSSSDSSGESVGNINDTSEEEISEEDSDNRCAECTEDYYSTSSKEDWIQCPTCLVWLHEFCTMYNPMCNRCGRKAKREEIGAK